MAIKASNQVSLVDITDAYSVTLTSEAFTFVGNTTGAPAGLSCTTQAVAYRGTTQCSKVSISTVTCPSGISATISNNNTASPTITFKTTATITKACEATIPIVVDSVTVNKKFSFAVAKQGEAGNLDDLNVTEKLNSELKIEGNKIDLTTGHFTINSKNMTLDKDGNATFSGKVSGSIIEGASGNFTKGFNVSTDIPTQYGSGKQTVVAEGGVTSIGFSVKPTSGDASGATENAVKITPEGVFIQAAGWGKGAAVDIAGSAGISFNSEGWGDFVFNGAEVEVKNGLSVSGHATINSTLTIANGSNSTLQMWSDGEGGNIRFNTPNKRGFWEMDAYNSNDFRIFHNNGSNYDVFYTFPSNGWLQSPNMSLNNGNLHFYTNGANRGQIFLHSNGGTLCLAIQSSDILFLFPNNNNGSGIVWVSGSIIYTNNISQWSARKYKKNIVDITEEAAEKLMDLVPVEFDYKDSGSHSSGFIADDTEKLFPHLIAYDKGEVCGLNYIGFIPYIVKKIQMQQKEINEQRKEINELKEQINKLMSVCGLS